MKNQTKILILGGGFAGVYTFLGLHQRFHRDPSVAITMVNRTDYFLFTPLLHEVATGGVSSENVVYNIRSILTCCLADFVRAEVQKVAMKRKIVKTSAGEIPYDILVYALGARTNFFTLSREEQKQCIALKTLEDAKRIKQRLVDVFKTERAPSVVVVGGGPTGVEMVAEIREFIETLRGIFSMIGREKIYLVHGGGRLIPQFHPRLGEQTKEILERRGIEVVLHDRVARVGRQSVQLQSGRTIAASLIVWTAGVTPNALGDCVVTPTLQAAHHPEIFIVGDALYWEGVPMTAQAAVAAARVAAQNIIAFIRGKPLQPFHYRHRGDLFSLGQWLAGAEIFGMRFFGHFAWWLWRTIYLSKIIGARNKIKVVVDWTLNLFLPRDINTY